MDTENKIFEILSNTSDSELLDILRNSEEYNEETFECAKYILSIRNVEIEDFHQTKRPPSAEKYLKSEIKGLKTRAYILLVLGLFVCIGGFALVLIVSFYGDFSVKGLLYFIIGAIKLHFASRAFKKSKILSRNRQLVIDSNLPSSDLHLVTELNKAIVDLQSNGTARLNAFVSRNITPENFEQVHQNYAQVFQEDFVDEIRNLSSKYSDIKKMLLPFIEMGILESEFPHRVLKQLHI